MVSELLQRLRGPRPLLYLAPQAGVSEAPFRRLCRRFGADVVVSEFVSAEGLRRGSDRTWRYLRFHEDERPLGAQTFGADPQGMAGAAAPGAEGCSAGCVDINCGRPGARAETGDGG